MSEEQVQQSFEERLTARLEAEYAGKDAVEAVEVEEPVEELDATGTPDNDAESEADDDGVLAEDDTEEESSDLDEETPEQESEEYVVLEKRFKDTQAALHEKSEELSKLRKEVSESIADITRTKFDLVDRTSESEQIARYWHDKALAQVQQARAINFAQVPPEQVAQAQQFIQNAEANYQQVSNELKQTMEQGKKLRDEAISREAAISRAQLTRDIPDFDAVYPELGKFAVDSGVNPKVFQEIVDPGLIKLINKAMTLSREPDTVETLKQTKAKVPRSRAVQEKARDAKGRFKKVDDAYRKETNPKRRAMLWEQRAQLRFEQEKR